MGIATLCGQPSPTFRLKNSFTDVCEGFFGLHRGFRLQLAFFMGFSTVVIVGMDHRYSYMGLPNEPHALQGPDPNHFDPSYFSGHTWDNPDLANSERFYAMARTAFEADNRRILDCTVGGACQVFEKSRLGGARCPSYVSTEDCVDHRRSRRNRCWPCGGTCRSWLVRAGV